MVNDEEPSLFKRVFLVNAIISAIFRLILFGISRLLGWEINI